MPSHAPPMRSKAKPVKRLPRCWLLAKGRIGGDALTDPDEAAHRRVGGGAEGTPAASPPTDQGALWGKGHPVECAGRPRERRSGGRAEGVAPPRPCGGPVRSGGRLRLLSPWTGAADGEWTRTQPGLWAGGLTDGRLGEPAGMDGRGRWRVDAHAPGTLGVRGCGRSVGRAGGPAGSNVGDSGGRRGLGGVACCASAL